MKKNTCYLALFLILGLLQSCAISQKVNYGGIIAYLPEIKAKSVNVAVWDQRKQVLDGSRKPNFTGYLRSGAGIAYPIGTLSGRPFVEVISADISASFRSKGCKSISVPTNSGENESSILNKLKKTPAERLILIKCIKLHTDGYGTQILSYALQISIYDNKGTVLINRPFTGEKFLGSGTGYKLYFPKGMKDLIQKIFSSSDILSALNSSETQQEPDISKSAKPKPVEPAIITSTISKSTTASKTDSIDVIYKRDGTEIKSKVIEIALETVKYKRHDQLNGPLRNLPKSEVFMIIYKDGTREVFKKK